MQKYVLGVDATFFLLYILKILFLIFHKVITRAHIFVQFKNEYVRSILYFRSELVRSNTKLRYGLKN